VGAPNRPIDRAAVVFDLEGVLVRHEVDIEEVRLRLAALFGPYGVTRAFRPILRRIREAVAEVAGSGAGGGSALGELERRAYAIVDELELAAAGRARAKGGAVEVVAELIARRVPLGLYTERGRACVGPTLAAAGLDSAAFVSIGAREDSFPPGPPRPVEANAPWANAPDHTPAVLAAAQGVALADVWLIADHPDDVRAARAASAQVPGLMVRPALLRGATPTTAAAGAPADQTLAALADILALPGLPS
jgi:phosphoglycolate phosphatase-like HAD superfamily hydrolase